MPADVTDRLRALRSLLDEQAPAVGADEVLERHATHGSVTAVDVPVLAVEDSRPGRSLGRIIGLVAAVGVVAVSGAVIAGRSTPPEQSATTGGAATSAAARTTPSFEGTDVVDELPSGLTLLADADTPFGRLRVATGNAASTCLYFDAPVPVYTAVVDGQSVDGHLESSCLDSFTADTGELYATFDVPGAPTLLAGFTATDIDFVAHVGDTDVTPEADGLWWATVPDGVTEFTISTTSGSTTLPIDVLAPTATTVDVVGTASASPECTVPPADRAPQRGECTLVDWDATRLNGSDVELEYYVNEPGCSLELAGVEADETAQAVVLRVVVAFAGDEGASCPTTYASRTTIVRLSQPLGDRTLLGCRPIGSFVPKGGYDTPEFRDPARDCTPLPAAGDFCTLLTDATNGHVDLADPDTVAAIVDHDGLSDTQRAALAAAVDDAVAQIALANGWSNDALVTATNDICDLHLTPVTMVE